jgi:hypothetical protein
VSQYDPAQYRTPPDGATSEECEPHTHRRRYDRGLIAPPTSVRHSGRIVVTLVCCCAVAFLGAFLSVGKSTSAACEQRQEVAKALRGIIQRGDERLDKLAEGGAFTPEDVELAHKENARAIKELTFPPC